MRPQGRPRSFQIGDPVGETTFTIVDTARTRNGIRYTASCSECGKKRNGSKTFVNITCPCQIGPNEYRNIDLRRRVSGIKAGAKSRNIGMELTDHQIVDMILEPCRYCGEKGGGIDRIFSDLEYSLENCVPACMVCNRMKMDQDPEIFFRKIVKITQNLGCEVK